MICAQPSVSTAVSLRITAFFFDMFVTPIDSTIVTTAASPSGTAATARLTATINTSITLLNISAGSPPARVERSMNNENAKMKTQIPSTRKVRVLESPASFFWSGVCPSSAFVMASAILPISVFMPVSVTTALPRP